MKASHRDDRETSVTFSLTELMHMETDRLREEERARARDRELRANEARRLAAQQREQEESALAAADQARAARLREDAAESARRAAEQQAALQVARIEAESKARLAADEAGRAHELALLRTRRAGDAGRWRAAFLAVTTVSVCVLGASLWSGQREAAAAQADVTRERTARQAAEEARAGAGRDEATALERREAGVRARAAAVGAEPLGVGTETARRAAFADPSSAPRLAAYRDALDTWQGRVEALEREAHRAELEAARRAAGATKPAGTTTTVVRPPDARPPGVCANPGDPLCGLDGRPL